MNIKLNITMKNLVVLSLSFFVLALGFSSCKKLNDKNAGTNPFGSSNNNNTTPTPVDPLKEVGPLPADYTKKVVLEEFTGEWCGWCPEGAEVMKQAIATYPNKVVGIAVHDGDPMEIPSYNTWIKALTQVGGFPNGSVDRATATGRGSWMGQIGQNITKSAPVGLALVTKLNGNMANIKVFVGVKDLAATGGADNRLTVMITEDEVAQSPSGQSNYSQTVVVDANWKHSHVLRGIVTANEGDLIDLTSPKKYAIVEFLNVDLSSMNITDLTKVSVVAFINKNTDPRDIFNAQEVKLGETKKWD